MKLTCLTRLEVNECLVRLSAAAIGESDPSAFRGAIRRKGLFGSQYLVVSRQSGHRFCLQPYYGDTETYEVAFS